MKENVFKVSILLIVLTVLASCSLEDSNSLSTSSKLEEEDHYRFMNEFFMPMCTNNSCRGSNAQMIFSRPIYWDKEIYDVKSYCCGKRDNHYRSYTETLVLFECSNCGNNYEGRRIENIKCYDNPKTVQFTDGNLEKAVRDYIKKPTGTIFISEVLNIKKIYAESLNIKSLEGIQHFKNLTRLFVNKNNIKDITPVKYLTHMENLSLKHNEISDLSPIKNLRKLKYLHLDNNKIVDISPLRNLSTLEYLYLSRNNIANIDIIKYLTNLKATNIIENRIINIPNLENNVSLTCINFSNNKIVDVTNLGKLKNISSLDLRGNNIKDITPFKKLSTMTYLDIRSNKMYMRPTNSKVVTYLKKNFGCRVLYQYGNLLY